MIVVISEQFTDLALVKKQQLVMATLKEPLASGKLHAVSVKAYTPDEWLDRQLNKEQGLLQIQHNKRELCQDYMKTFIKVAEIWIPGKDRTQLELDSGAYGGLEDFKTASEQTRFNYYEGVPGTAWALGHPVVVKEFTHSCFKRTEAAKKAGLTCAIGIPVFSGEFLMAVVVFLCGDDEEHAGAIEVWGNDPDGSDGWVLSTATTVHWTILSLSPGKPES